MRILAALLLAVPAFAAVDGTVINATSGKPAAGIAIALAQPGPGGLAALGGATTDAAGKFTIEQSPKGPGILQVLHQGVTYTKMLIPGAPTTGLAVQIYDSTAKPVAKVAQHMILLQPDGTNVTVNETIILEGDPKFTYADPANGTVRFFAPAGVKEKPRASVTGAFGVALQQPVSETKQPGVYRLDYPIKPGENRVDITYGIPQASPAVFSGKVLHRDGKTRLVVPNGVSLDGENITMVGKEPQTQATIYDVTGDAYKVQITGTGALQQPEAAADEDNGAPKIEQAAPHVYKNLYWITGLSFAILGLGTYLLAKK